MQGRNGLRRTLVAASLGCCLLWVTGCSWVSGVFGHDKDKGNTVSVFSVTVGQCFNPPADVKTELSELTAIPCTDAHSQEAYASLEYKPPSGEDASTYPGEAALTTFAQGACADAFTDYVGISYLDSSLYFTYLLPSARSWEQGKDHSVLCFVTTTGQPLTASVKGSKR